MQHKFVVIVFISVWHACVWHSAPRHNLHPHPRSCLNKYNIKLQNESFVLAQEVYQVCICAEGNPYCDLIKHRTQTCHNTSLRGKGKTQFSFVFFICFQLGVTFQHCCKQCAGQKVISKASKTDFQNQETVKTQMGISKYEAPLCPNAGSSRPIPFLARVLSVKGQKYLLLLVQ